MIGVMLLTENHLRKWQFTFYKSRQERNEKRNKKLRMKVLQLHRSKLPSRMKLRLDLSLFY